MLFIGDSSQFYDKGLDPLDLTPYVCPSCGAEKDVVEEYDKLQEMFFVRSMKDTVCSFCDTYMERKNTKEEI